MQLRDKVITDMDELDRLKRVNRNRRQSFGEIPQYGFCPFCDSGEVFEHQGLLSCGCCGHAVRALKTASEETPQGALQPRYNWITGRYETVRHPELF